MYELYVYTSWVNVCGCMCAIVCVGGWVLVCVIYLRCTGWQELDGNSLISRNTTGEEDSVVIVEKCDQAFYLLYSEGMLGFPPTVSVYSGC